MLPALTSKIYEFEDFRLVPDEGLLLRSGKPIDLNPKAFAVLAMLVEHNGHLVSKTELLDKVWEGAFIEEGAISKAVWFARNALGDTSKERFIKTVPRRGYRFVAPVSTGSGSGAFRLAEYPKPQHNNTALSSLIDKPVNHNPTAADAGLRSQGNGAKDIGPLIAGREPTRGLSLSHQLIAGSALVLTVGGLLAYLWATGSFTRAGEPASVPLRSLAVTLLQNTSGSEKDYLAHGISTGLKNSLSGIPGLRVAARPSAIGDTSPESLNKVASELSVDGVLTGTFTQNDGVVKVTMDLWSVPDQKVKWSNEFAGTVDDMTGLRSQILDELSRALGVTVSRDKAGPAALRRPVDAAAEDAYFKGEYYFDTAANATKLSDKVSLYSRAISEYERAISIDSQYVEAYASLSRAYHWLGSGGRPDAYLKSRAAALAAIQLEPSNAKAHASLAWVYWRLDWDWGRAEAEYQQALAGNDALSSPLAHGYALFISAQGRHEEAIEIIRRSEESNPLSLAAKVSSAFIYLRARRFETAEVNFRRVLELDPEHTPAMSGLALTLACIGRADEAVTMARHTAGRSDNPAQSLTLAWVYAKAGRTSEAAAIVDQAQKQVLVNHLRNDPYAIAKVYAGLGEADKAFEWLERAFAVRSQYLVFMAVSPEFDSISGDPRFAEMIKRLGIPRT